MKAGDAGLLVNECIIPEQKPSRFMTIADINVMSLGGIERTERLYGELLEAAGLNVELIRYPEDAVSKCVTNTVIA
jgi:hypothetical protein